MSQRVQLIQEILKSRERSGRNRSKYTLKRFLYPGDVQLTLVELEILREIAAVQQITQMELVSIMGRTKGAISQIMEKLWIKGLLSPVEDDSDMRKKIYCLSALGQRVMAEDKKQQDTLFGILEKRLENLDEEHLKSYLQINEQIRDVVMEFYNLDT